MKRILIALLIVACILPLSSLVVLAQSAAAPMTLEASQVKLLDDSSAPLITYSYSYSYSYGYSITLRPDLTLSSSNINFTPSSPTTQNVTTITATIRNTGKTSATNVVVRFSTGSTPIGDTMISSIMAGGTAIASVTWGPVTARTYMVTVVVDPGNTITESNEYNNAASKSVTVTEAGSPPPPQPPPPSSATGDKWALLIGISDYQGTANDLWNPANDAIDMQTALTTKYGFLPDHIKMLLNSQATYQGILSAIDWLAGVESANSTVVFLFSGHGYRAPDSSGWDTDKEADGYDEGIVSYDMHGLPDGILKQKFAAFESQKFALIFGSCYSGGMFDDANDLQAPGRVICSACKANQYGWDYSNLGNTLFGYYFVDQGILHGLADSNHDGQVSMQEALAYAYPRVTALQPQSQPQIYDGFTGELVP